MDKRIELSCAKVVSLSKDGKWSQSFSFENLYCVLEISGKVGFETSLLGKQLIEETQRRYLGEESKNWEFVKSLITLFQEKVSPEISLNAAICLQTGMILYLGTLNCARILFKREEKLGAILKGEKEIETASGFLKDKDKIILETENFAKVIDDQKLNQAMDNRKAQEVADILAPEVQAQEGFGGVGMIIEVEVIKEEKEKRGQQETEETTFEVSETLPRQETAQLPKTTPQEPEKAKPFFNIKNFLTTTLFSLKEKTTKFFSGRPIYIHGQDEKNNKKRKLATNIAIIVLILLFISIFFNLKKKTLSTMQIKFNEAYTLAFKKQEEGRVLMDLNPVRSRTLLEDGRKTLEEVRPLLDKNKKLKTKLEKLLSEINDELEIVSRIYRLKELTLFFDLTLIKDKAKGKAMTVDNENLFVYDSYNKSLYLINLQNKSQEILAGGRDIENTKSLTTIADKIFLLTEKNIYLVSQDGKEKREAVVIKKEKEEIKDIFSFGSNIYLLDTKNNRIWKYVLTESGFSEIKNYLSEGINPDFSDAVSFSIDGAIYVLKENSEILKFIRGNTDNFNISGLEENLNNPKKIYTREDLKNVYFLDLGNKRIVVIDKKGQYQSQYVNSEIGKVEDMVVSSDEKKIYLVVESKIYEIEIK